MARSTIRLDDPIVRRDLAQILGGDDAAKAVIDRWSQSRKHPVYVPLQELAAANHMLAKQYPNPAEAPDAAWAGIARVLRSYFCNRIRLASLNEYVKARMDEASGQEPAPRRQRRRLSPEAAEARRVTLGKARAAMAEKRQKLADETEAEAVPAQPATNGHASKRDDPMAKAHAALAEKRRLNRERKAAGAAAK